MRYVTNATEVLISEDYETVEHLDAVLARNRDRESCREEWVI
jgi:hypothetical protein